MATLAELRRHNDAIESQMRDWQQHRRAAGEDAMDWPAFRAWLTSRSAPDPGDTPPNEFFWHQGGEAPIASAEPAEPQPESGGKVVSAVNSLRPDAIATDDTSTWPDEAGAGSMTSNWPQEKPPGR